MQENKIILLIEKFKSLHLSKIIDFDKFNEYAITHHSTSIEGSTLTEIETRLLLEEGVTPKGKPLVHSLMVMDHYNALLFIIKCAKEDKSITPEFIQQINAQVMKQTGSVYETVFGQIDSSKGAYRKGNVSAGNSYFVNYDKVPILVKELCNQIKVMNPNSILEQIYQSFDAHFSLVSIHPFYDGNGRTSRLLMNYILVQFHLPMAIVFKEDKAAYFESLIASRAKENKEIFREFMYDQYAKYLQSEIDKFEKM